MEPVTPDRDALLRRFLQRRAALLGYLRVLTRDDSAAEDAFQETVLVVVRKLAEFDPGRDFEAWVRGIGRHVAQRVMEQRRPREVSPALLAALEATYDERGAGEDEEEVAALEHLRQCLEKLRADQRRMLELRYGEGLSLEALAARLGRSAGAVQVALSRLRR